ncbi:hypothetical protein BDF14DRAFT_534483 [Spinellus fusiger]|nr:hypothetical protein BDF14DRAFT_534483 [Spinellus fusiger]
MGMHLLNKMSPLYLFFVLMLPLQQISGYSESPSHSASIDIGLTLTTESLSINESTKTSSTKVVESFKAYAKESSIHLDHTTVSIQTISNKQPTETQSSVKIQSSTKTQSSVKIQSSTKTQSSVKIQSATKIQSSVKTHSTTTSLPLSDVKEKSVGLDKKTIAHHSFKHSAGNNFSQQITHSQHSTNVVSNTTNVKSQATHEPVKHIVNTSNDTYHSMSSVDNTSSLLSDNLSSVPLVSTKTTIHPTSTYDCNSVLTMPADQIDADLLTYCFGTMTLSSKSIHHQSITSLPISNIPETVHSLASEDFVKSCIDKMKEVVIKSCSDMLSSQSIPPMHNFINSCIKSELFTATELCVYTSSTDVKVPSQFLQTPKPNESKLKYIKKIETSKHEKDTKSTSTHLVSTSIMPAASVTVTSSKSFDIDYSAMALNSTEILSASNDNSTEILSASNDIITQSFFTSSDNHTHTVSVSSDNGTYIVSVFNEDSTYIVSVSEDNITVLDVVPESNPKLESCFLDQLVSMSKECLSSTRMSSQSNSESMYDCINKQMSVIQSHCNPTLYPTNDLGISSIQGDDTNSRDVIGGPEALMNRALDKGRLIGVVGHPEKMSYWQMVM